MSTGFGLEVVVPSPIAPFEPVPKHLSEKSVCAAHECPVAVATEATLPAPETAVGECTLLEPSPQGAQPS